MRTHGNANFIMDIVFKILLRSWPCAASTPSKQGLRKNAPLPCPSPASGRGDIVIMLTKTPSPPKGGRGLGRGGTPYRRHIQNQHLPIKSTQHWARSIISGSIAICCLLIAPLAQAAGKIQFVVGDVRISNSAGEQRAKKGDPVNTGDSLVSNKGGWAQIRMDDGGMLALRPNSTVRIDQYQYNGKQDGSEKAVISLVKGSVRAVTGAIGQLNKENYKIKTPSATIGIRGTDHEPAFFTPEMAAEENLEPGTYDKVNSGSAYIETAGGTVFIEHNEVGFALNDTVAPQILPQVPQFFEQSQHERPDAKQATEHGDRQQESQDHREHPDKGEPQDKADHQPDGEPDPRKRPGPDMNMSPGDMRQPEPGTHDQAETDMKMPGGFIAEPFEPKADERMDVEDAGMPNGEPKFPPLGPDPLGQGPLGPAPLAEMNPEFRPEQPFFQPPALIDPSNTNTLLPIDPVLNTPPPVYCIICTTPPAP